MKEGWIESTIGDCFFSIKNGANIKQVKGATGIPITRIETLSNGIFNRDRLGYANIGDVTKYESYILNDGDILVSHINSMKYIGRAVLYKKKGNETIIHGMNLLSIVSDKTKIIPDFARYYFQTESYKKDIQSISNQSVNQASFNVTSFKKISFKYPSLSEQTRIVEKLDAAFEKIDRLKENAEKGLQAVKDLWEATLTKELSHKEGWKETSIGEICEIVRGKRFVRADIVENGVPCIHYGDMYTHYGMSATKAKGCVSPELAKKLRFANKNDVVVVAAGENKYDIGVGMVWLGSEPAVVHDACFILKHSQNPMFLSYYFRSTPYHRYLKDEVNEGKICSFLTKPLAAAKISLPPLAVQNEIVKKLDDVRDRVEKLIANYKETIDSYAPLKQAILRKAFSGEL